VTWQGSLALSRVDPSTLDRCLSPVSLVLPAAVAAFTKVHHFCRRLYVDGISRKMDSTGKIAVENQPALFTKLQGAAESNFNLLH
jgi:hypothetical protein